MTEKRSIVLANCISRRCFEHFVFSQFRVLHFQSGHNPFVKTGFGFNHETGFGSLLQMDWTVCLLVVINI